MTFAELRGHSPILANTRKFLRTVGGTAWSGLVEDWIHEMMLLKTPRRTALTPTACWHPSATYHPFGVWKLALTI
jgi:hypothetical protein